MPHPAQEIPVINLIGQLMPSSSKKTYNSTMAAAEIAALCFFKDAIEIVPSASDSGKAARTFDAMQ